MNCIEEDILNVDIDSDFLISLVGKLSLDNLPDEVSETLQSLEEGTDRKNATASSFLANSPCSSSSLNKPERKIFTVVPTSSELENKDGFLSSIGLYSGPHSQEVKNECLPQDNFLDESANLWNKLAYDSKRHRESCRAKEKQVKIKDVSSRKKSSKKKDANFNITINSTCDNTKPYRQRLPALADASIPKKSVNSLHEVFSQQGILYDIQLSNLGDGLKLSYQSADETANFGSTLQASSDKIDNSDNSLLVDKSLDAAEKSVYSPDSGYDTSPCPGAVSPCSPSLSYPDHPNPDPIDYDNLSEEGFKKLLTDMIEFENSLTDTKVPESNANVPVFKDAINHQNHIERLLDFLKEEPKDDSPNLNPLTSQLRDEDEKSDSPDLAVENSPHINSELYSKVSKKLSPRTKKHKLGFEFKYAVKNELRHSSIFTKGKHVSKRDKILKQIQDDENIQKQIKLIQGLVGSKKIKRMSSGDRENKRRRIQSTDSCFDSDP